MFGNLILSLYILYTYCLVFHTNSVLSQEFPVVGNETQANTTNVKNTTSITPNGTNSTTLNSTTTNTTTLNTTTTSFTTTEVNVKTNATVAPKPVSTTESSVSTVAVVPPTTVYPMRPTRPQPTTTPSPVCRTSAGPVQNTPCQFPFIYEGREHNYCTRLEWDHLWCATMTDGEDGFIDGQWGECGQECTDVGPLRCYYKYALADTAAQLRYCRPEEDLCVLATLRHEDGNKYQSQYCSNTSLEDWWPGAGTCQYGREGGYRCACDYNGCNFDKHSAGYFTLKERLMPLVIAMFQAGLVILCCLCCCRCCCKPKKRR